MPFSDALRKQDARIASRLGFEDAASLYSAENPCSTQCYYTMDDSRSVEGCVITSEQHATIRSMAISARENKDRSCNISFQLRLPCWRVHNEISLMDPRIIRPPMPEQKKLAWYNNQRKLLKDHWQDMTDAHAHERRGQVSSVRRILQERPWCSKLTMDSAPMMALVMNKQKESVLVINPRFFARAGVVALIPVLAGGPDARVIQMV